MKSNPMKVTHRLVSAPQLGNVAGHIDRFERHVVRVELVIDPASPIRSNMGESLIRMAMPQRSRPISGD
jgi:hypothetical protein